MKLNVIIFFVVGMVIASCNNSTENTTDVETDIIEISRAQFDTEKMELGEASLNPFVDAVHITGTISPAINGLAQISLTMPGTINRIFCKPGQFVNKGTAFFEVSSNDFIDLQKDFAESSAIVSKLKANFLRAEKLYKDSITTQKEFISAKSNYLAENAKYMALRIKLENLGLDVSKIEKGDFYSSYNVKASINGFVSSINVAIGQYIEPHEKIAEIIDNKSYQLRFSVFEKNINKIKTGQTVAFYLNGNKVVPYKAFINAIGKTIRPNSKSIECFATINNLNNVNVANNQFIEGEVYTSVNSVLSVPETAILNSENDSYILLYNKEVDAVYYFKKVKIKTGRIANNYVELLEQLPSGKLLVSGIYNIQIE